MKKWILLIAMLFLLTGCFTSDQKVVEDCAKALKIETTVTSDVALPIEMNGVSISWISSLPEVMSSDGKINRGLADVTVTLTACLTKGTYVMSVPFNVVVKAISDDTLLAVFNKLTIEQIATSNISLPTSVDGVIVSWESSNPDLLSSLGVVETCSVDTEVTLTAVLTYNNETITKTFNVLVKKSRDVILNEALNSLKIDTVITNDLSLPANVGDVLVTWTSSDVNIITNEGKIFKKPEVQTVLLKATLSYLGLTLEKSFEITIQPLVIDILQNAYDELVIPTFTSTDILLPLSIDNVTIVWESSNEEVMSNEGKIIKLIKKQTITLNAVLSYSGQTLTKSFTINLMPPLESVFGLLNNYEIMFESDFGFGKQTIIYYIDNDKMKTTITNNDESTVYYVVEIDGVEYLLVQDETSIKPYNELQADYYDYYNEVFYETADFSVIDVKEFRLENGKYVTNNQDIAKAFFGMDEYEGGLNGSFSSTFTEFSISLDDEVVVSAKGTFKAILIGTSIEQEFSYKATLRNFDKVVITVPEFLDTTIITPISDLADHLNETVTVKGVVSGTVGNNFYINDGVAGTYVYSPTSNPGLSARLNVTVTGVVKSYSGLVEITEGIVTIVNGSIQNQPVELMGLDKMTNYLGFSVNTDLLTIVSIDKLNKGSDIIFTVTDGITNSKVFASKWLANYSDVFTIMSNYSVNDKIKFSSATVTVNNGYQIAITEQTKIESEDFVPNIELSSYHIYVYVGTKFEEIIADLNVYYNDAPNSSVLLAKDQYVVSGSYDETVEGTNKLVVTYNNMQTEFLVVVRAATSTTKVLADLSVEYNVTIGIPSIGDAKVLVMPIEFTDALANSSVKSNLEKAFFGEASATGWQSVRSYYYEASFGKLNITGDVLDPYNTKKSRSYYSKRYDRGLDAQAEILKEALEYYDSSIDYSEYDSNSDGYIDCIYLIYMGDISYDITDSELWWAVTTEYVTEDYEYYDGVEADYNILAGYEFIQEALYYDEYGDPVHISCNATTYIHETGHALGLDDYYDYDQSQGTDGGLGGADMMDGNVGDHNAFSKAILGWITPTVVTETMTVTINSATTGQALLVARDWNNSYFTEYFIIDLFTPTGLNEATAGCYGQFSKTGVRIYHVDATQTTKEIYSIFDVYKYNNAGAAHKLIGYVEADGNNSIDKTSTAENSDLFVAGDIFNTGKWYTDNKNVGFTVKVDSLTQDKATITIEFTN